MAGGQDGQAREKTPRRTTRRTTATPIRDVSPPARNARATSTAVEGTPANKRSARAASRRTDQPRNAMTNSALPEIQTRQSYAYGSSKTPLLPEQLHARDTLTMKQVADQMDTAMHRAEQNLETRAAELDETRQQSHEANDKTQTRNRKQSNNASPDSETTEVQKKQRTAMWASNLEEDQLDDIAEEETEQELETPDTRRTEPSSFPSGIFDHSYQYERGARPARNAPTVRDHSATSRLHDGLDKVILWSGQARDLFGTVLQFVGQWFRRLIDSTSRTVLDLPDSVAFSILVKTFSFLALTSLMSYALCSGYTRLLCTPGSSSAVSRALESLCGSCRTAAPYIELGPSSQTDIPKLTFALRQIDSQIRSIEARLNSRIDNRFSSVNTDIESLRQEQSNLVRQLEHVSYRAAQQTASHDVASPLIPLINYFSPANGAIVHPGYTSPTREVPVALPLRVLARMVGMRKYRMHGPVTALEPWQDVGDCWCAAATTPSQDSIRLGVGVRELIYATELVIEHPPKDVSLMPETAPKRVELWADFAHLTASQRRDLETDTTPESSGSPFGPTHVLIASVDYDLAAHAGHIQRFALHVNQYGDTKYAARDYVIRVRSTYGGKYGCLYRMRLHGIPMQKRTTDFAVDVEEDRGMEGDEMM